MLEVGGSLVLPQAAQVAVISSSCLLGQRSGVVGQAFLSGDLSVRGMLLGGAEFSRKARVTLAPGTHPRTFPTAPLPSPISLHFE